jgi:hypothetical protein
MEVLLHGVSCFLLEALILPFPLGDGVIMGKTPSFPPNLSLQAVSRERESGTWKEKKFP